MFTPSACLHKQTEGVKEYKMFNRRFKKAIPLILSIAFFLALGLRVSEERWFRLIGVYEDVRIKVDINDVNNLAPSLNTRLASVTDTVHIKVDINDVNNLAPSLNTRVASVADTVHIKVDINDVNNLAPSLNTNIASVANTVHVKVDINDVNDLAPSLNTHVASVADTVHIKVDINDVNDLAPSLNTRVASVADTVHIKVDINDVNELAPNLNVKVNDVNIFKTTTLDEIDAWQIVTAGTLVVGNAEDLSDCTKAILYVECAPIEAVATDGAQGWVEVSYGEENWILLYPFTGTAETVATTTIVGTVADSNTAIHLTDATTGDFDVIGRKWFIKDGTIANSEVVRTQSIATNLVTLCDDVINGHAAGISVYDRVDSWIISLSSASPASKTRVIFNNVDADCDAAYHTWISKEKR